MPAAKIGDKIVDARPDRPDLRDRIYSPPLRNLPLSYPSAAEIATFLPAYTKTHGLILDQGREGACTGFGLAAVVNYLQFRRFIFETRDQHGNEDAQEPVLPKRVSPWMAYDLARRYDEWPGEDYEGSSCRGAMKGWFHHGICDEHLWAREISGQQPGFRAPAKIDRDWAENAPQHTLGAYYRVMKDAIADMQAAVVETGAIYVSAKVHAGWQIGLRDRLSVLEWQRGEKTIGGHAFAIVGYTKDGFIVQNSWGEDWGYLGFAVMQYDDWMTNGSDAWVASMGAPAAGASPNVVLSSSRIVEKIAPNLAVGLVNGANAEMAATPPKKGKPNWSITDTVKHCLILGRNGAPERVTIDDSTLAEAIDKIVYDHPRQWLTDTGKRKIGIVIHGGLNDQDAGIKRASVLGPCFLENDVYPIFAVWNSGILETIKNILFADVEIPADVNAAFWDEIKDQVTEPSDYLLEQTAEDVGGALWRNMKDRCIASGLGQGGMVQLLAGYQRLLEEFPDLELHLLGHSAGSIMIGSLLDLLKDSPASVNTCTLFAPACSAQFAVQHFIPAMQAGKLPGDQTHVHCLSNRMERKDTVGPYFKSLLYLVSRSFEVHKTPIMGMERLWDPVKNDDTFADTFHPIIAKFRNSWEEANGRRPTILDKERVKIAPNKFVDAVHGCFDNSITHVTAAIELMRGQALAEPIADLDY
jgi:hypothetical protein